MELNKAISLAKKGNTLAQRHLYEQYKVRLFRVCLRYGRDRSDAKDILQEGFIQIFKNIHQFKGEGDIGSWMRQVIVYTALQYLRKWKKDWNHLDSNDFESVFQTEADVFHRLGLEELTRMIQQLPRGYRIVFNLYVIEGYSHKEIAEITGVTKKVAEHRIYAAFAVLRGQLQDFKLMSQMAL